MTEVTKMADTETPVDDDDPSAWGTTIVGIVGSIIVVAFVYLVSGAYYLAQEQETDENLVLRANVELVEYRQSQEDWLAHGGTWTTEDPKQQRRATPIVQAMEEVAKEY